MEKLKYKRVVVKIGTNVITKENGLLDKKRIENLTEQISNLKKQGIDVIIVSSGAVGAGIPKIKLPEKTNRIVKRQILASIGQIDLINTYSRYFKKHDFLCAQVLATKEDFRDRKHYLNMKNCFDALLRDEIIPIVNENDVISVDELMFTDNDELAGLIGAMMDTDAVFLLTTVDGVLNGDPKSPKTKVIKEIDPKKKNFAKYITPQKSQFGRGGMITKCKIAHKLSMIGISTHIVNGTCKNILLKLVKGQNPGTRFIPQKKVSSVKKWIAHSKGNEKGKIYVNDRAEKVLKEKVCSLLPVGITKIGGKFRKGDIVQIRNEKEDILGLGIAQYGSSIARDLMGKKGKKALIHYDYLFLEL